MNTLSDFFEVDPQSGDIYAVRPLDRETQSMHFLYVNVVAKSRQPRENPAIEGMKYLIFLMIFDIQMLNLD